MKNVEHWDDERSLGNGIIITLVMGQSFEYMNHEGVRGFDTAQEAKEAVKSCYKCDCEECFDFLNK